MPKLVIEIDSKLKEGEILVYRNGKFHPVDIHYLLPEIEVLRKNLLSLENRVLTNEKDLSIYKDKVNEKLKQHHDALKEITKNDN